MKRMFTAVAALTLLAVGNAARGVEYCNDPPDPFYGPFWAYPDCEDPTIRVFGASAIAVTTTDLGVTLRIRAMTVTNEDRFYGVTIDAPDYDFGSIEFGPPETGAWSAAWPLGVQFLSPIGSVVVISDAFLDSSGPTMNVELTGNIVHVYDVLGTVGNLAATYALNFRIGGDLGYIDEDPTAVLFRGNVGSLHVAGDLLAQFVVLNNGDYSMLDSIEDLTVGGNIGVSDPTNATEEYAGRIATANRIRFLTARNVYGSIWPGEIDAFSYKSIHRLEVRRENGVGGDFFGALYADQIDMQAGEPGRLWVQGDFGGTVRLEQPLSPQTSAFVLPQIVIDGSMVEGVRFHSRILLPEDGLEGQIIVNRADDGGAWEHGVVFVGDVELDMANYAALPNAVGGGLVGEAPFALHAQASYPPHGTVIPVTPCPWWEGDDCENGPIPPAVCEPALTVYLQHYGPLVEFTTTPLRIETGPYRPTENEPEDWTDVTSDFEVDFDDIGIYTRLKVTRTAGNGKWPMDMWYRFTPVPDVLKCLHVEGEPDVRPYDHRFAIQWVCDGGILLQAFDLNNDETLDSGDVAAWVADPVDLNEDDAADSADLDLLINVVNNHGDN